MVKQVKFLFIVGVTLALSLTTCKKDYPDDIPKWLVEKIKELKKETRGKKNTCCSSVYEYPFDESVVYSIYSITENESFRRKVNTLYTLEGEVFCQLCESPYDDLPGTIVCGSINPDEIPNCPLIGDIYDFFETVESDRRVIWKELE